MFTTWTRDNRIVDNALMTRYTTTRTSEGSRTPYWEYHRFRTKSYRYVGLTESAAKLCADAMLKKYTRTFHNWKNSGSSGWQKDLSEDGTYVDLVASVEAVHGDGNIWDVVISVDEETILYMNTPSIDLDQSFRYYIGEWDYDED